MEIDRISPSLDPGGRVAMLQSWRHLLFLHWEVPESELRPLVPPELSIDTFEGRAFVGLVPFTMTGVRPIFVPSFPPISDFHETNIRTYVHLNGQNPGVWFFSLDAANSLAVRIARAVWKLPYHFANMQLEMYTDISQSAPSPHIYYGTERLWPGPKPATCEVSYQVTGSPKPSNPGSLEHFLAERYYLYTKAGKKLFRGQVYHSAYPLQTAALDSLKENMIEAAGIVHGSEAPLVHYSAGVDVKVYPLRTVVDSTFTHI